MAFRHQGLHRRHEKQGRPRRDAGVVKDVVWRRIDPELRLACAVRVHEDLRITADYWGPKP